MIPLVDLKAQYLTIETEINNAISETLSNAQFVAGNSVTEFEIEFAKYSSAKYGIGVASGTAALNLILRACDIGPGDEVITTPFTFIATVEAIATLGAKPILVDIDPSNFNIDPNQVSSAISNRTKAIIPVHLYGQPADMDPLIDMSHRYGLHLIEDAAQSHGAEYKGAKTGSIGVAACFSFYPAKNLGAYGDGGMVITSNPKINEMVRLLRDHGRTDKYTHIQIGFGERLDTIQAAILRVKLRHLDEWTEKRRVIAKLYNQYLGDTIAKLPSENPYSKHVYHLYVVRVPARDNVANYLNNQGIGSGIHYPVPLHLQPALSYLGYQVGDLPHAELAAKEVMSLPIFPEMKESQVTTVSNTLRQALSV